MEPKTTRRGFLALAGATASLAALSQLRALPAQASALPAGSFFSADELAIFGSVAERIVVPGDAAPRFTQTRALETVDRMCTALSPPLTEPLPALLRLVEYGTFVFDFRFARFSRSSAEQQDASLRGWMESRFALRRLGFYALRNLSLLAYYAQDEVWPAIGYAGPLQDRKGAA